MLQNQNFKNIFKLLALYLLFVCLDLSLGKTLCHHLRTALATAPSATTSTTSSSLATTTTTTTTTTITTTTTTS
jgi:hypothetical protein